MGPGERVLSSGVGGVGKLLREGDDRGEKCGDGLLLEENLIIGFGGYG